MYPPKANEYYPNPPAPSMAPAAATGFPLSSTGPYYTSTHTGALETQSQRREVWSTGLCGCCDDVGNCCITCWCPCVTFGRVAEIVDRGSTSCGASGALYTLIMWVTCCHCIYSCFYRTKMRGQYSLRESPCNDCLVHCFCEHCALCQEYRELQRRGFDMTIGWHANMERQGHGLTVPPVMQEGMSR